MHVKKGLKIGGMIALMALGCLGFGQAVNTTLKSQINLATFGSGSGNDCWGYVSPSGREYAIVGLNNKVAFVEITNPSNPVLLATIPHTSSTWGDIKVYRGFAYAVSESLTGLQVIDMRDIDNGNVTLVQTLASPGRTHNLCMDEVNGFLYTCGSRNGTGTTMCFNLADPANPVQVGPASMTTNYMHDAQVVTYTSGPMAGKQIFYGFSEGRGVDIYDMTDKAAPVMIKRAIYPNMNYCHQGWISEDKRFLYVDDELDEGGLNVPTRSLIFNIEDPMNAFYVGTFTTGLPAIDHNQYWDDGFLFQANYRSGLRIFDSLDNPTMPIEVGSYDTYPANDNRGYDGAWSCYPFFPSGNIIVSDINGGLFVVDAKAALTRNRKPTAMTVAAGSISGGTVENLSVADGQVVSLRPGSTVLPGRYFVALETTMTAPDENPDSIKVGVTSRGNVRGYLQTVDIYDWITNDWVEIDSRRLLATNTDLELPTFGQQSRYVQAVTKLVKVRVRYRPESNNSPRIEAFVDRLVIKVLR